MTDASHFLRASERFWICFDWQCSARADKFHTLPCIPQMVYCDCIVRLYKVTFFHPCVYSFDGLYNVTFIYRTQLVNLLEIRKVHLLFCTIVSFHTVDHCSTTGFSTVPTPFRKSAPCDYGNTVTLSTTRLTFESTDNTSFSVQTI